MFDAVTATFGGDDEGSGFDRLSGLATTPDAVLDELRELYRRDARGPCRLPLLGRRSRLRFMLARRAVTTLAGGETP